MYHPTILDVKQPVGSYGYNNLANEENWRDLIVDDRTNGNIFFDVDIQPLNPLLPLGMTDNGEQVVINKDDNHLIACHGKQYALLKNADAFDAVQNTLNALASKGKLDMDGAFIKDAVVQKGGKVIRQYFFPAHRVSVGSGDSVILRLVVINSYDGSCNCQVQAGGFRIVCTNGLVTGEKFLSLNARHSGEMDLTRMMRNVETAITSFSNMGLYWQQLIKTPLSDAHADKLLTALATENNTTSFAKFEMFDRLYREHKHDLGANYWAMYNTITAWSTHYKVNENNIANLENVRLKREGDVGVFLKNPLWEVKAAA
jgi:hypothetical protein